jgi:drug/metabolite transporter (DMT)-like permease
VPCPNSVYLALFGVTQFGLGLVLLTMGTRLVTAIRSSLINPLARAWVWLAFGEVPTFATCIGGPIVVVAIVCEAVVKKG